MLGKYKVIALVLTVGFGYATVGFCQADLYAAPTIVPTLDSRPTPFYAPPVSQTYPAVDTSAPSTSVQPVAYPSAPYAYQPNAYQPNVYQPNAYPAAGQMATPQVAAGGPMLTGPRYAGVGYSSPAALAFTSPQNPNATANIPGMHPNSAGSSGPTRLPAKPLKPEPNDAGSNLTSTMLHESHSGVGATTTYSLPGCDCYPQTQTPTCPTPTLPCVQPCSPWYATAGALFMTRNSANRVWVSYQADREANQLMNTDDIGLAWRGGGEITFGRTFCCGAWGVEATYWALDPFAGDATVSHPNGVSTPLIVDYLDFGAHDATEYFYGACSQRLWRRDEIHNAEINFLCNQSYGCSDPCSVPSSQVRWILGMRFFRFEEGLTFASLDQGYSWWDEGGTHQAYIDDNIKNNLWGLQTGVELEWGRHLNPYGLSLYVSPKIGIYGNYMEHRFDIYRGDGLQATPDPTSGVVGSYPVESTGGCVSFLGEIDAGIDWRFHDRWSARIGYRVVAVSGIGLADHQIPTYVNDIPEIAHISRNGDLVLHGGYLGVTYNY